MPDLERETVGAVVIGRNEGERLIRCLVTLVPVMDRIIYVDSGSTDGSAAAAQRCGAEVIQLNMSAPFTAARARNAGFIRLAEVGMPSLVQFVDGDCEIYPNWIGTARAFLDKNPDVAIVCGRLRECHPETSVYNRLLDQEWNTPIGESQTCGGNAMIRSAAFQSVGGFNPLLIAGEELELCVRLRQSGWSIWRLDAEMGLHDAAMTRFSQWWRRATRAGYASAEAMTIHRTSSERPGVVQTRRALLWSAVLPASILFGALVTPWWLLLLWAYPAQVLRLAPREGWTRAAFLTLGKFPEAQGVFTYAWRRLRGGPSQLIEYK